MVNASGIDLSVKIGKLELPYPTFMGSGCYGSGEEFAPFIDLAQIGAVVLKSVTPSPRLGNPTPRLVHTPAGMLNAITRFRNTQVALARSWGASPVSASTITRT
jgi:dihydroorotate dehydrogenase